MVHRPRRAACLARGLAARAWLVFVAGCQSADPLERAGVRFQASPGWKPVAATTWPVPGTPLGAWSGPAGASLVVYEALPVPGGRASTLAEATANRLENLPGLRVVARGTEEVGGLEAARVVVVAPGTGDALAPSGTGVALAPPGKVLTPTRRVVVSVPRGADTLSIVWHAPEAQSEALDAQVRAACRSLKIDPGRRATSSY